MADTIRIPRRKKGAKSHPKEAPFPIPIQTITGKQSSNDRWYYYTGYFRDNCVVIEDSGDLTFLYKMVSRTNVQCTVVFHTRRATNACCRVAHMLTEMKFNSLQVYSPARVQLAIPIIFATPSLIGTFVSAPPPPPPPPPEITFEDPFRYKDQSADTFSSSQKKKEFRDTDKKAPLEITFEYPLHNRQSSQFLKWGGGGGGGGGVKILIYGMAQLISYVISFN